MVPEELDDVVSPRHVGFDCLSSFAEVPGDEGDPPEVRSFVVITTEDGGT